jgi:hypothetical protein
MAGFSSEEHSIMYFAQHKVDPVLGVSFSSWLHIYWQEKYGNTTMDDSVRNAARKEAENIEKILLRKIDPGTRRWMWFSLNRYFRYWEINSSFKL